jgi:hypothetical protein
MLFSLDFFVERKDLLDLNKLFFIYKAVVLKSAL